MKRKIIAGSIVLVVLVLVIYIVTILVNKDKDAYFKINPAFSPYISGFTTGIVSTSADIKIRLNFDYANDEMIGNECRLGLFEFSPDIAGKTVWIDKQTVSFKPEKKLPHDKIYKIDFHLHKLLQMPDSLAVFKFYIHTMKQAMDVKLINVMPYDNESGDAYEYVKIIGEVNTADFAVNEDIEKVLSISGDNINAEFEWVHSENSKTHVFYVDSLQRRATSYNVKLSWNGQYINTKQKGSNNIEIPGINDFKMTRAKTLQAPEQEIIIQFSDPLASEQNLDGLIRMNSTFRYFIEGNELHIFPLRNLTGFQTVVIEKAVCNTLGDKLPKRETAGVTFEEIKPNVRLKDNGVIVPSSNGFIFPFEAVNLNAVDVKIVKIFENNVLQFLQNNNYDGSYDLHSVGRLILEKTIDLTNSEIVDFGKWNSFAINLEELIRTEPGAIYQISISFKKEYSTYPCNDNVEQVEHLTIIPTVNPDDRVYDRMGYYDYGYDYEYSDYYEDYNWYEREDPCKPSYYYNKSVSRNFIASNLGIIAKKGNDEKIHVFVNDLRTTRPWSNVTLEFYNLQQQLITTTKTNRDGKAEVSLTKPAYFIVAKAGNQKAYLKLDNNNALSLSSFDISGSTNNKGYKGFIYGERGVWRPGDTLFLSFIFEDKLQRLPISHPVAFTLLNPMGQIVYRTVKTNSLNGFYTFIVPTSNDAPTGNWTAQVDVGGSVFSKTIKIETIMPNRLKIELKIEGDKLIAYENQNILLKSAWLHGATAKNLRADINITLSKSKTSFDQYPKYVFDDASRAFYTTDYELFNGRLNENGEAVIAPDIDFNLEAPGVLNAAFQVRVFENSGAFSIDRFSMPFYSYRSYVGIKVPEGEGYNNVLTTDKNHRINIVNLDAHGRLVPGNTATVEVYKIDWNWWWDESDNGSNYLNSYYLTPMHTEEVSLPSGRGHFNFKVEKPEWGRYFIRVTDNQSKHSCGGFVYIDYPEWVGRNRMRESSAASLLTITTNKNSFNVGENIELTFPSGEAGRALVCIEKGSEIIESHWVETERGHTTFIFEATREMTPNAFASVTYLQPHAQVQNDLPIRLYGVVPVSVEDEKTILKPVITMPDVIRPGQIARLRIKEEHNNAMTYTIAVVDEGLLDLTRFKTPNPWLYFYAKEALSIRTWDLYDFIAGANAGQLRRLLAIGGDDELAPGAESAKANRFKPMVRFLGPFHLEKGRSNNHSFDVPQYVGSVRVMVVAGYKGAYGNAEKNVAVRNPLMLLGTLPRVLGPNETVELPVSVFAMENQIRNVRVKLETNNLFTIDGNAQQNITFESIGDKIIMYKLKTASEVGIGRVKITAVSGNQRAEHTIEMDIRNPNPRVVDVVEMMIEPGKTLNKAFKAIGIRGSNKGTLEVSGVPPINLEKRLNYLIAYPHGCLEQTTSSVFPQLYIENFMELKQEEKDRIQVNVNAAIRKINSLQISNGGLSYWPGANYTDDWSTNYAGHFMIEASNKGYTMPVGFIDKFVKYQQKMAASWVPQTHYYNSDLIQAYRLYTLALVRKADVGAMNRLREQRSLSVAAKWRLAAAYTLIGQNQAARRLTGNLSMQIPAYSEMSYTYGSSLRDKSMILEALILMGENAKASHLARIISEELASDEWLSTQSTAYSLIALSHFYKNVGVHETLSYTYKLPGTQGNYNGNTIIHQSDMAFRGQAVEGNCEIKNTGRGVLFARMILEGIPEPGLETSSENNLRMRLNYKTTNGENFSVNTIKHGSDFIGEIIVENPGLRGEYKEIALSYIVPSGWEISNPRLSQGESTLRLSSYNYMDIRDDRINLYFNLRPNETKVFQFSFNAAYLGRFYLPAVYTETMYDNSINAKIAGKWIEIVQEE
ncbi:MAG: MG2 domain-containing protein [Bacteroidales bacterium]|nr:MG2 domain-containing protein [Bacteroidales bacterium]